jgi:hypothetical protein
MRFMQIWQWAHGIVEISAVVRFLVLGMAMVGCVAWFVGCGRRRAGFVDPGASRVGVPGLVSGFPFEVWTGAGQT